MAPFFFPIVLVMIGAIESASLCIDVSSAHDARRRVSSVPSPKRVNRSKIAQAVSPTRVVYDLFQGLIGNIQIILLVNAVLIVIVMLSLMHYSIMPPPANACVRRSIRTRGENV